MEKHIELLNQIKDVSKDRETLYKLMDELKIPYKRTNCKRCLTDYYNIVREEIGLIGNAAEVSEFNEADEEATYTYNHHRAVRVNGKVYNKNSKQEDLRELHRLLGAAYVKKV